ncbi:E3 ubiquitin-protein ligase DMA1 [Talaromyces islandicus]|uniref:E3 ubiquitin-protein ligase DMA1 n=1 Tax=Talaromyces islandicus TaxID=28573 RepID=A0A0U1LQC0_TALIS|nr:E3 ubiquitin-protein ligase DMA1 [Talaromyces islandicus]
MSASATEPNRTGRLRRLSQLRTYTQNHLIPLSSSSSSSSPPAASSLPAALASPAPRNNTTTSAKRRNRNSLSHLVGLSSPFHFSTSASAPEPEQQLPPHNTITATTTTTTTTSTVTPVVAHDPRSSTSGSVSTDSAELQDQTDSSASSHAPAGPAAAEPAMPAAAAPDDDHGQQAGPASAPEASPALTSDAESASAARPNMSSKTIRFFSHQDPHHSSRPSLQFPPMSRIIPSEDSIIRIGRYSERDGVPVANPTEPSDAPIGFKSKVVSRKHCEFSFSNGQWHIKDVGSSSGTFLNRIRLSPPNIPSRLYAVRDGDVVQLGIDFRGGEEMIFRCVRIRIECNRTWQQRPNEFNKNTENLINNLGKGKAAADFAGCRECSICLGSVLRPYQCLFMAACAHVWHYKCISRLIHSRDYPMFQCPNCRVWTDLNAEVDDTVDLDEESQLELDSKPADRENGNDTVTTQNDSAVPEEQRSSGPARVSRDTTETDDLAAIVENMDLGDRNTPMQDGENPDSGNNSTAETGVPDESTGRSANIPIPTNSSLRLRPTSPESCAPETFEDNPMTPRNDSGPLALDGRTGRLHREERYVSPSPCRLGPVVGSAKLSPHGVISTNIDQTTSCRLLDTTMRFSEPTTPTGGAAPDLRQGFPNPRHHFRAGTHPFMLSSRKKPRRLPLVFRFIKGAIHGAILIPVFCHAVFTAVVVVLDRHVFNTVGLPSTIIPSLSIVVGLMLVFRNQTSYNRFWDGRNGIQTVHTSIRNLVRNILTHAYTADRPLTSAEKDDVERTIRFLMAIPYAVKNHLRAEWGAAWAGRIIGQDIDEDGEAVFNPVYASLLPVGLEGHEQDGLGLPFQLTFFVDGFIKRGLLRNWFSAPGASQMQAQLGTLTQAIGSCEVIKMTPIPVAHLIHQKQVLALFGCVLPFAMVDELSWWTIPIVTLVIFTLYGIEGIGSQLEDPFGYDRNDIKMDAIVSDANVEIEVILDEWRRTTAAAEIAAKQALTPEDQVVPSPTLPTSPRYQPGDLFLRSRPRSVNVNWERGL